MMRFLVPILLLLCPTPVLAQPLEGLAAQDVRLARIGDEMLIANAGLCRQTMPVTGMVLHSVDQYGAEAEGFFAAGPLVIALVVPGSAADRAGLVAGDTITAIGPVPVSALAVPESIHLREVAFHRLADIPDGEEVNLTVARDGEQRPIGFAAPRGCRSLVEILVTDGPDARSDGRVIQVQLEFAATLSDEQMAVILSHELAHTVLEHRRRKDAEGIDNTSIWRHVGRNQGVNRQAEVEADRLSVHLLANAGYDPALVPQFWQSPEGIRAGGGKMPSFIYPSQAARADIVSHEIAMYLPLRRGPSWPGHLIELRERSLADD